MCPNFFSSINGGFDIHEGLEGEYSDVSMHIR